METIGISSTLGLPLWGLGDVWGVEDWDLSEAVASKETKP